MPGAKKIKITLFTGEGSDEADTFTNILSHWSYPKTLFVFVLHKHKFVFVFVKELFCIPKTPS